jgi:tetratricopeptide (TPR) repeat protein
MLAAEQHGSVPPEEEQGSAPGARALFAIAALVLFRWAVYGPVSMATTKEVDAREKLQALLARTQAALRNNQFEEASHPLEELTRIQPKNHVYWWQRATVLAELRRANEEADVLEQFVKVAPLPGEACPQLPFVYRDLGKNAEALDAFKRCAAFSPDDLQDAFYYGYALERELQNDKAFEVYQAALKKGVSADLESGLGRMFLRKGKPAAALQTVQPALQRNPENSDALLVAGIAFTRLGKYRDAKTMLDRAAVRHDDSDIQYALGVVAEVTGHRKEALAHYESSIAFDAKNDDAKNRRALLLGKPLRGGGSE